MVEDIVVPIMEDEDDEEEEEEMVKSVAIEGLAEVVVLRI